MSPTRKKRSPKTYIAEHLRRVLGENVRTYMAARYARERTLTDQMRALSRDSGVATATIERVIKGQTGPSLDTINQLAEALEEPTYRLLIDPLERNFLIDARDVVSGRTEIRRTDEAPPDAASPVSRRIPR